MKARATGNGSDKMGLAWAAVTVETLAVSHDNGSVGRGTAVLGLGRLSPSRIGVNVAWVLL